MLKIRLNLKKVVAIAICLAGGATIIAQEEETGVNVNGTIWATRNVGESGTFVERLDVVGEYYTWAKAQTVCPEGWRTPSLDDFINLRNAAVSYWGARWDVWGRTYNTASHPVFLPSTPNTGMYECYWTSSICTEHNVTAQVLSWYFSNGGSAGSEMHHGMYDSRLNDYQYPVRCVKDAAPVAVDEASLESASISGYYTPFGVKLDKEPENGIYIIVYDNGKAKKTVKLP